MKITLSFLSVFRDWRLIREMKEKPWLISRITNPSEWVQLAAVKKDASFIGLIAHPTEKVQLEAISRNATLIKDIHNPTEKVQLIAVRKDPHVITEIRRPCQEACKEAIKEYFGNIGPINNSRVLVAATQKLFKAILEIENRYCKMKTDASFSDSTLDKARLVDKADGFRIEKISQALLVFKKEVGIVLSQHNGWNRSGLKQPVPLVNKNKKEIIINH